jgi:hypothetical protein
VYIFVEVIEMAAENKNPDCVAVCRKAIETAGIECPGWDMKKNKWLFESSDGVRPIRKVLNVIINKGVPCQRERWPYGHDGECQTFITALCGDLSGYAGEWD